MLIRQLIFLGLTCAFWAGAVSALAAQAVDAACPPEPVPPSRALMMKAQEEAVDRGFLWRLSRGGRDSFVYGTLHVGRPGWFALGRQTEAALFRTGVLALEINVTDPAELAVLRGAMQGSPRVLPSELVHALGAAWRAECLPVTDLEQGAAELQVMQLAAAQAQRWGLFALYSAESVLLLRSLRLQRPVVGLESAQTQLSALLARNDSEAVAMVGAALAELQRPQAAATLERLVGAWARGDLQTLQTYADWCDCMQTATEREVFARLVDGRNPGMADTIEKIHADVSVFAAVGALHLVGPQGLPELLKARGFVVTRVF